MGKAAKWQHLKVANIAAATYFVVVTLLPSHVIEKLIICVISSVEYLLHMQCCMLAQLQHLILAEYYTCSFSTDFIPLLSYFVAVLITCYILSAE